MTPLLSLTGWHNGHGDLQVWPAPVPSNAKPMNRLFSKALLRLACCSVAAAEARVVAASSRSVK
jgi:hypothetical protein